MKFILTATINKIFICLSNKSIDIVVLYRYVQSYLWKMRTKIKWNERQCYETLRFHPFKKKKTLSFFSTYFLLHFSLFSLNKTSNAHKSIRKTALHSLTQARNYEYIHCTPEQKGSTINKIHFASKIITRKKKTRGKNIVKEDARFIFKKISILYKISTLSPTHVYWKWCRQFILHFSNAKISIYFLKLFMNRLFSANLFFPNFMHWY